MKSPILWAMMVVLAAASAVGEEEYLYFKSGWGGYGDVAARGYRCLPFIKHGKSSADAVYSFRAEKGVPEWVAFVPRVRVNGRELPPFAFLAGTKVSIAGLDTVDRNVKRYTLATFANGYTGRAELADDTQIPAKWELRQDGSTIKVVYPTGSTMIFR